MTRRPQVNVAYFSPLSPVRSGISDYSQELLPLLGPLVDRLDLFVDGYTPDCRGITEQFSCHPAERFPDLAAQAGYDVVLYQQGNNPHHEYIYRRAMETPGVVVLHDYVLHHLLTEMTLARGDEQAYLEMMLANHGPIGYRMGRLRIDGLWSDLQHFLYPACWQLLRASRGVLVHSPYMARLLRGHLPSSIPVRRVPMGIVLPVQGADQQTRAAARQRLELSPDTLVIGSFGFVTPMKQLDLALRAVALVRQQLSQPVCFVVVGEVSDACPLQEQAAALGLGDAVRFTGYIDAPAFNEYLHAVDLALNLRYPTAGETSASLLRVMGSGVPVVVPRYRQYADIPQETCVHLDPGDGEDERLSSLIAELAGDPERCLRLGQAARDFVAREHSLEGAARGYADFLEGLGSGTAGESEEQRGQTSRWIGLAPRMPAGSGPCAGDGYRRNSRVPGGLDAGVRVLDRILSAGAGEEGCVRLEITNRGDTVWISEPNLHGGYVIVAARIFDRRGRLCGPEQQWQQLPENMGPGSTKVINCPFRFPHRPGNYSVRFDLLDVGISWFSMDQQPAERLPGFDVTVG